MRAILFYVCYVFWYLMSLLPFKVLYFISDLLFYPMYYLLRYRRKVVRRNLVNAFPERTTDDIVSIEKKFYHSLCDYFVESMKLYGMSAERVKKHMYFDGLDELHKQIYVGKSCVVYMAHTFNWEFATSMPLHIKSDNVQVGQIYHPLENKYFDEFYIKLREQYNSECIAMKSTLRRILEIGKERRQFVIGFIADQVPTWESIKHWVDFFHQDTPVFTGTEKIAARTKSAVFFLRFNRKTRGKYVGRFELMSEDASQLPENELTNMYYRVLEDSIRETPELWLWTHKRWKRTRAGYMERERIRVQERREKAERAAAKKQ